MSILFSGDFHANAVNEIHCITKKSLISTFGQEKYNAIQYHVILGDGGFLWPGNHKTDIYNYKILTNRPFPILCVMGNHEPILGMNHIAEVDIGIGETLYQIHDNPFIAYFKRGKIYSFEGFRFLVLGGALSIDKEYREPNVSWWEQEYWTEKEKQDLFMLLERETAFDYVLSHTGPHRINIKAFQERNPYSKKYHDEVAFLNDKIDVIIQCRQWWCGHWHRDFYYFDEELYRGYQYLYRTTKILCTPSD